MNHQFIIHLMCMERAMWWLGAISVGKRPIEERERACAHGFLAEEGARKRATLTWQTRVCICVWECLYLEVTNIY